MNKKEYEDLRKSILDDLKSPCAVCGKTGTMRSAASYRTVETYNGKILWVSTHYTFNHMYIGLGKGSEVAGVCNRCSKKIHISSALHEFFSRLKYLLKELHEQLRFSKPVCERSGKIQTTEPKRRKRTFKKNK